MARSCRYHTLVYCSKPFTKSAQITAVTRCSKGNKMKSDVIKYTVELPKILLDIVADAGHLTLDSWINCQRVSSQKLHRSYSLQCILSSPCVLPECPWPAYAAMSTKNLVARRCT